MVCNNLKVTNKPMRINVLFTSLFILLFIACTKDNHDLKLREDPAIDHTCTDLAGIPAEWITAAKTTLHIAYGHTSHGSQITNGMKGLVTFKGNDYEWNNGGTGGALDLHDYAMPGDLGNPKISCCKQRCKRSYVVVVRASIIRNRSRYQHLSQPDDRFGRRFS